MFFYKSALNQLKTQMDIIKGEFQIMYNYDLIDHIEHDLSEMCNCEAVIHMDPISVNDPETAALKEQIRIIIKDIDENLQFHDFRIVKGPTHTNMLFDVLVPYKFPIKDSELIVMIDRKVKELDPTYFIVVKVDHTYI